jgi:hypothetical protein
MLPLKAVTASPGGTTLHHAKPVSSQPLSSRLIIFLWMLAVSSKFLPLAVGTFISVVDSNRLTSVQG